MTVFLSRIRMILTLQCGEASRLMSDALDRRLTWYERLALRGHLIACRTCPAVKRQFELIGRTARGLRDKVTTADQPPPTLSEAARERMRERLREATE